MGVTRYFGLDISATSTGYCVIDHAETTGELFLRTVDVIKTPPSYRHQGQAVKYTEGERLHKLRETLWQILDDYQPDVFIKEGRAVNFSRFHASEITGKATGVVEECVASSFTKYNHQDFIEYKPSTIKKHVAGNGKADKEDVKLGVFKYFDKEKNNFPFKKKRDGVEYIDDATDAVGAILTHFIINKIPFHTVEGGR